MYGNEQSKILLEVGGIDMKIDKDEILQYGFYDEQQKYNIVLNVEKLKEIFSADNILLDEKEHK